MAAYAPVRSAFLLLLLAGPLHAALLAHVQTTKGLVTVELQHATAPQAVANFMTLAQGSRSRVDPLSGAVTNTPLYIGEKFFRTSNSASYKFAQTGSGSGDNAGTTGFTFRDEFTPTVRHTGYTLSSANAGPNTNGGQIFFTGNVAISQYDDVHSIIGLVPDPASRTVIDAIIAGGDNGSTITGITFTQTDPEAVAFNELGQNLPVVIGPGGSLLVQPGVAATWNLNPVISTGAIFRAFRSTSLGGGWSELESARQHVGIGTALLTPILFQAPLDDAANARAFYHLSVANHPGALAPSSVAGRTVHFTIGGDTFDYVFNPAGNGGTTTFDSASAAPASFPFTLFSFGTTAHSLSFIADHGTGVPLTRYFLVKIGCDSATNPLISGRHATSYFNSFFGWQPAGSGPATITR